MSSQTAQTPTRRAPRKTELEEPYPPNLEPKQNHFGNALAILSVMAVLAFGLWAAFSTLTSDTPAAKASATAAPTKAVVQATAAATATPTAVAASPTAPAQATSESPGSGKIHVVGAGDTLYGIARRYGTTVEAIMEANGFTDRSKILHVGDRLVIP